MTVYDQIFANAEGLRDQLIRWRRTIHACPELGLKEEKTSRLVGETLARHAIPSMVGIGETGVVATIEGGGDPAQSRNVALRADMDALPIQEENETTYRSTVAGVMHACGHDGHTAMLLGAGIILHSLGERVPGRVKLVFQPAEEQSFVGRGGARDLVASGVLEMPGVTSIAALHLDPDLPVGVVGIKDGPFMAGTTTFEVAVHGRAAHGARPHQGVDAIYLASLLVLSLQGIVARETNALDAKVVTVGEIRGGISPNIIADHVLLRGTLRGLTAETLKTVEDLIDRRCREIALAFGGEARTSFQRLYPPVVNHPRVTQAIRYACSLSPLVTEIRELSTPNMGGDDFAFYTERIPGAMFRLGCSTPGGTTRLHTPTFDFDENVLPAGAALLAATAVRMLEVL